MIYSLCYTQFAGGFLISLVPPKVSAKMSLGQIFLCWNRHGLFVNEMRMPRTIRNKRHNGDLLPVPRRYPGIAEASQVEYIVQSPCIASGISPNIVH